MLSNQASINPDTSSLPTALLELSGPLNGHVVSFRAGISIGVDLENPFLDSPVTGPSKLPPRRGGFNQVLKMSDGMKVYLRTGEYPDGRLGEIFIDTQKFGTFTRSMLNCFAMSISAGLQHGVPLKVFVDLFKDTMFEPKGSVYGSDVISEATSILDAIFRELEHAYPDGKACVPASSKSRKP